MAKDLKLSRFLFECASVTLDASVREGLNTLSQRLRDGTADGDDLRAAVEFMRMARRAAEGGGDPKMRPYGSIFRARQARYEEENPKS